MKSSPRIPALLLTLALCAVILLPVLAYRMGVDQGVFAYMGWRLLEGDWPYLETWESDFPGMVYLHALELLVFGKAIWAFRLFDILYQLLNVYLIYRIAERLFGAAPAFVASCLYALIYQGYGSWNTSQREGFALLFLLLGYWLFLTHERRARWLTAASIGLGFGLASMFKPTLVVVGAMYLPLFRIRRAESRRLLIVAGAASALPFLIVLGAYWARDGLTEIYDACIRYQAIYTARLGTGEPPWLEWWNKFRGLGGTSVALAVGYLPFAFFGPHLRERRILYFGYLLATFTVAWQGTYAGYHYLPGLAFAAVLIASAFSITLDKLQDWHFPLASRRWTAAALLVAAAAPVYYWEQPVRHLRTLAFLDPPVGADYRNLAVFDFAESWRAAEYLRERTDPDDTILIWGYESLTYYLAERRAASRFQTTHPLVMRPPGGDLSPMQLHWRDIFMSEVSASRPAYIAVLSGDDWWWAPEEKTSAELLEDFPRWKRFIEERYRLETEIGRFHIYRRNAAGR